MFHDPETISCKKQRGRRAHHGLTWVLDQPSECHVTQRGLSSLLRHISPRGECDRGSGPSPAIERRRAPFISEDCARGGAGPAHLASRCHRRPGPGRHIGRDRSALPAAGATCPFWSGHSFVQRPQACQALSASHARPQRRCLPQWLSPAANACAEAAGLAPQPRHDVEGQADRNKMRPPPDILESQKLDDAALPLPFAPTKTDPAGDSPHPLRSE